MCLVNASTDDFSSITGGGGEGEGEGARPTTGGGAKQVCQALLTHDSVGEPFGEPFGDAAGGTGSVRGPALSIAAVEEEVTDAEIPVLVLD